MEVSEGSGVEGAGCSRLDQTGAVHSRIPKLLVLCAICHAIDRSMRCRSCWSASAFTVWIRLIGSLMHAAVRCAATPCHPQSSHTTQLPRRAPLLTCSVAVSFEARRWRQTQPQARIQARPRTLRANSQTLHGAPYLSRPATPRLQPRVERFASSAPRWWESLEPRSLASLAAPARLSRYSQRCSAQLPPTLCVAASAPSPLPLPQPLSRHVPRCTAVLDAASIAPLVG